MDFAAILRALMTERELGVRALARRVPCDPGLISRLANGRARPSRKIAARLDEELRAGGRLAVLTAPAAQQSASQEDDEDPVRRRDFVGVASATIFGAVLGDTPQSAPAAGVEAFAAALATYAPAPSAAGAPPALSALGAEVAAVKRQYQACRYTSVISQVPPLLNELQVACAALDGEDRRQAYALSAAAYHVAASILLKLGDQGLAWLAADRSMHAAQASEDPLILGGSARIVTHALMAGGHLPAAVSTTRALATRLDSQIPRADGRSLSVYGALLLRGAIAAAQHNDRAVASELLDEASQAACRTGTDRNHCWTAFGPVNVQVHRVSIAVMLGDAGTAIDTARSIDFASIPITERKASLLIDTARAFLQWGKHEKAYTLLRAAERLAHDEVAARPSACQLVRQLAAASPPDIRRKTEEFARRLGTPG